MVDADLGITFLPEMAEGSARRSLSVMVLDAQGHAAMAGAEARVYAAGTRRLLGTRLIDTGSGYNAQNAMPVHFGLPTTGLVDIEVITPRGGSRTATRARRVDPRQWQGKTFTVRADAGAR